MEEFQNFWWLYFYQHFKILEVTTINKIWGRNQIYIRDF